MAKKDKIERKRALRRERARLRAEGILPEDQLQAQEAGADEAVSKASKAPVAEPQKKERKAPKEEPPDNAWIRLKNFLREVDIERKKINWPTSEDAWRSTWVTIIFIISLSLFMGAASWGVEKAAEQIFRGNIDVAAQPAGNIPTTPLGSVDMNEANEQTTGTGGDTGGVNDTVGGQPEAPAPD